MWRQCIRNLRDWVMQSGQPWRGKLQSNFRIFLQAIRSKPKAVEQLYDLKVLARSFGLVAVLHALGI